MRLSAVVGMVKTSTEFGLRYRTAMALFGGTLAVLPTFLLTGGTANWEATASRGVLGGDGGHGVIHPGENPFGVDGSLPAPPNPEALTVDLPPSGPLGIPGSALRAYRNAADLMTAERASCRIDWALIASIGRIESNHARGGHLDAKGNTLAPILGPVLNGAGPVAAIRDTDGGVFDGDTVWDRAVGPTQFIPSTWDGYAADGNGDGEKNPNNIFDATLGSAKYLCSGGMDLGDPGQLRAAIFRYNRSDAYVSTVIRWAEAYRAGAQEVPDSQIPVGADPAAPVTSTPPAPVTPPPVDPGTPSVPPGEPGGPGPSNPSSEPPPTCESNPPSSEPLSSEPPSSVPSSSSTPSLPPCDPPSSESSEPPSSSESAATP